MMTPQKITNFKEMNKIELERQFYLACSNNNLEKLDFFYNLYDIKSDIVKYKVVNEGIVYAVAGGHLNIVKYLMSDPKFNKMGSSCYDNSKPFLEACEKGDENIIKYLLTSKDSMFPADITVDDNKGVNMLCCLGHFKVVKYLLASTQLKDNKEAITVFTLNEVYMKNKLEAEYLVFDFKVEVNDLSLIGNEDLRQLLIIRDLKEKLDKDLGMIKEDKSLRKIKI